MSVKTYLWIEDRIGKASYIILDSIYARVMSGRNCGRKNEQSRISKGS